jgi:predicted RNase H-like HicB family nuclease
MSKKSKKLNRPFPPAVLSRAKKIADKYEIIISVEEGRYFGKGVEMPYVFGDGKTCEECINNTREALTSAVAHLIEKDEIVPAPAVQGKKDTQVNIRLNAEEKAILSAAASAKGYRGLADFIRAIVLPYKTV